MKFSLFWFSFSMALLLFGVPSNKPVMAQSAEESATVDEIIGNTDNWIGKTVNLTGTIDELKDDNTFTLEGDNYFDSDRVLIINNSGEPLPELPDEKTTIRITGEVDTVEGGKYFDFEGTQIDLPESSIEEYENKPAIYADSIILAPDPVEIVETPANFYDREVAVTGKVAEVLDDNAFTLKEFSLKSDRNLLVLNMTGEPMPESDADVLVKGQVKAYDREQLEQEYGYGEDLSVYITDDSNSESGETAVLIVEEIQAADVDLTNVDVDVDVSP